MVVNQKELANILGITARRVRQLKEEGFFTTAENGRKYKLEICVQEYIEYKIKAEMNIGTLVVKEQEQAQHERIKKNISILKLRKLKREVHEAKYVELFLSEMLMNFKNHLLSIPSKLAIQLQGETDINKIIEILRNEMVETLEELSEYDPDKINRENSVEEEDDVEEEEEIE